MNSFTNTLYTNDNLFILNGMNTKSIDLIYLDPPFNSKCTYSAPIGSKSAGTSFKDMWSWADVNKFYLDRMFTNYPFGKFYKSSGHCNTTKGDRPMEYLTQKITKRRIDAI